MHLFKKRFKFAAARIFFISFATVILSLNLAQANPEDASFEVDLVRTQADATTQKVELAKAMYRTEYETHEYQVEVPYDETETYQEYEQVPHLNLKRICKSKMTF